MVARWWVRGWWFLVSILIAYEGISLLDGNPATPPLTQVILAAIPWWVTLPFLAWLLWHFWVRYRHRRKVQPPAASRRDTLYFQKVCPVCGSYSVGNSPSPAFCSNGHPTVVSDTYALGRHPGLESAWEAAILRTEGAKKRGR